MREEKGESLLGHVVLLADLVPEPLWWESIG